MKILTTDYKNRNPFSMIQLPWIGHLYSFRCGSPKGLGVLKKILRKLIPNRPVFSTFFNLFSEGKEGKFLYYSGEEKREIKFNLKNTQFHSVYFPEYKEGYELETSALMDIFLEDFPTATCLDIGANWGHFSLLMASHPKFKGKVHAFEPMPRVYKDLRDVVSQSGHADKITCHNMALSNDVGSGSMIMPDGFNTGKAMLSSNVGGVSVKLERLDNLPELSPDFLKVDAEGAEGIIFDGGREVLTQKKPMIFFESWSDLKNPQETLYPLKVLNELGYVFFEPTFLFEKNGYNYLLGYGDKEEGKVEGKIQLIELPMLSRFLYKKQLNIFACHKDRLDWLNSRFQELL